MVARALAFPAPPTCSLPGTHAGPMWPALALVKLCFQLGTEAGLAGLCRCEHCWGEHITSRSDRYILIHSPSDSVKEEGHSFDRRGLQG